MFKIKKWALAQAIFVEGERDIRQERKLVCLIQMILSSFVNCTNSTLTNTPKTSSANTKSFQGIMDKNLNDSRKKIEE